MRMRIARVVPLALVAALVVSALGACAPKQPSSVAPVTPTETPAAKVEPAVVRLGNLPTEDILPLWVAQQKGLLDTIGVKLEVVPFQSAQERDAAFTAGAIDGFMGDIIAASELYDAGFKTRIVTVCLGATPSEGRFGIVSAPDSTVRKVTQLEGVPVGTSSGTIQEYVLDKLEEEGGVPATGIKKEEIKKVPVRFELLMNNGIKAAALPEPFLSLAVKQGAHLVADDTKGANVSQTVLVFSQDYLSKPAGADAAAKLLDAWDAGVAELDKDPNAYRALLVDKARLPKPVADSYKINTYPTHQLPGEPEVAAVLEWMKGKKLLKRDIPYADMTWAPGQKVEASPNPTTAPETSQPSSATSTP